MGATGNGKAVGGGHLVLVCCCIDRIETVTGHIVRRAVNRLQQETVTFACGREHCKGVPRCMDPSPVDLHYRKISVYTGKKSGVGSSFRYRVRYGLSVSATLYVSPFTSVT